MARIGAALALDLMHQLLLHRSQPPAVEYQRSVLIRTELLHAGKDDVDVGMSGVAVLSRDPAQALGAAVSLEATDGSPGQLAQVQPLGMLG